MAATGLFIETSPDISNADMITVAQRADALGYHSLWTGESWGRVRTPSRASFPLEKTTAVCLIAHLSGFMLGDGMAFDNRDC